MEQSAYPLSLLRPRLVALAFAAAPLGSACHHEETPAPAASASAVSSAAKPAPTFSRTSADEMLLQWDLGKMPVPADNPQSDPKIELGHELFFDKRLSADHARSCYSCHRNEDGNGGHEPIAVGANDKKLTRHSPVLWNVGYLPKLGWDGRAESLEAQATAALESNLMGLGPDKLAAKAAEIGKIPGYAQAFKAAFPGEGATAKTLVQAIASYERTLVCNDTRYDKYAQGQKNALTDREKRGLEVFTGKAYCIMCHTPPFFSLGYMGAGAFFDVGIGTEGKEEKDVDVGRMGVTEKENDWAAFKPPSLRNVSKSAPYFHDGSRATLEAAVRFMAGGGAKNKNLTPIIADKKLTDEEVGQIIAFLGALDCDRKLEPPKKLP